MRHARIAWSALATLLAVAAPAQQRRPLAGLVRDAAGKPVAGARVLLAGDTSPTWSAATDLVTTTTDDGGRFHALVLECVEYDAWAVGPERADGSWLASLPVHGVVPGPRLELQTLPQRPRTLHLHGLAAWAELAPFQARLWLVGSGHAATLPVDADGVAAVPREWPAGDVLVEVLDGKGQTLTLAKVINGTWIADVAAPMPIDVQVADEAGKPLAGVAIERWFRTGERLEPLGYRVRRMHAVLGSTDAAGRLRVRVAANGGEASSPMNLELRARKPGFADGSGNSFRDGLFTAAGPEQIIDGVRRLSFVLRQAREFRGEVLLAPGRPLANCTLRVGTRDILRSRNVGLYMEDQRRAVTDAEGRFHIDQLADDTMCIGVWLGDAALAALVGAQRHTRAFPPGQPFVAAAAVAEPPQLRIDLSQLGRIALQVVDERDGPASGALVVLQSETGDAAYLADGDPRFRLDPAGRATVLLARGPWFLCATDGARGVWQSIVVGKDESELRLQLHPWPLLRGNVRDAAGKPVAGARLEPRSYSPGSSRLDYLHVTLLQRWLQQVTSDADGRFELPFLPGTHVEYAVRMTAGDRSSDEFVLVDQGEPLDVRLH